MKTEAGENEKVCIGELGLNVRNLKWQDIRTTLGRFINE